MSERNAPPTLLALQDYVFHRPVPVGVSNRHVHLCDADISRLFGPRHLLSKRRDIVQKGKFSCQEVVTVATSAGVLRDVRVMGPSRARTQVELAPSDARELGLRAPLRPSGDTNDSAGCVLIGPKGSIDLAAGVLIPERHLHMSPRDTAFFGVAQGDRLRVAVPGRRGGLLADVLVRVHERFVLELHLDTDEAGALLARNGDLTYVVDDERLGVDLNLRLARPPGGRRLMTESELRRVVRTEGRVRIPHGVLLTPSARDLARRLKLD